MEKSRLQRFTQAGLFASRWLLAPFYVGLAIALGGLLVVFVDSLYSELAALVVTPIAKLPEAGILMSLSLIDLSLTANLVIVVILSGYENFVARIDTVQDVQRPDWMGKIDFSGLKMKLIGSIVSISAIALLRTYLELADHPIDQAALLWQVVILLAFVVAGVLMALMDLIVSRTEPH
jgi:uncharacterized protein (TIGR00645 family)